MTADPNRWRNVHASEPKSLAGDNIDDYRIEKKLGQGATGAVHKAVALRGPLRGRTIAIKIIQKALLNTPKRRRRVACEISLHQSLPSHPSIVRFEHSFEDDGNIYILTEFCSGSTLFAHLQDHYPTGLAESQASPIFLSLVQAVSFLHDNDILHRDLKLTNVLLTNTLQVRIADFGLATKLADATIDQEMTMCGTPNYISPEIVKRDPYGLASDVWSLGCMLVSLLTGRPPFQGEHISETLSLVSRGAYRPLSRGCSRDVKSLVDSILQVDPKRRPTIPQIMNHSFVKSAIATYDPNRSPLADTLYGLSNTRNRKVQPRALQMLTSPKHMANRMVPLKFRTTHRQADRVDYRTQGHSNGRPPEAQKHCDFNFGETVQNREHNPWSKTTSSYQGLLNNVRSGSNQGYDQSPADYNHQKDHEHVLLPARDSLDDTSEPDVETSDVYQKHRQEIPFPEQQYRSLSYRPFTSTRTSPQRSLQPPRGYLPQGHDIQGHYSDLPDYERPFRGEIFPRAQPTVVTSNEPMRHSMVAHVEDRFSQHYNDYVAQAPFPRGTAGEVPAPVVSDGPITDSRQYANAPRFTDPDINSETIVPNNKISINPATPAEVLIERGDMHNDFNQATGKLSSRPSQDMEQAIRLDEQANLVKLVENIVLRDEQAGDLKAGVDTDNSANDDQEISYDLVSKYKFSTTDLKATSQISKHGEVSIGESGQVNVRLAKDDRSLLISPDGMEITIISDDQAQRQYSLEDLPARCLMAYRYASKFVNVARSKTVKIALDSNIAKCRLYLNDNFEVVLLKEERKIGFNPHLRTIKIADHHVVLWKGHLDEVENTMRDYVRQALVWWGRCRDAMEDPTDATPESVSPPQNIPAVKSRSTSLSARFIDGLGWCEQREDGKVWILFFLDGTSMELYTVPRLLRITDHEGLKVEHKLEAGLPDNVRKRLKLASKAMAAFV